MKIIKQIDDLNREVWTFTFINQTLYLDTYELSSRESVRKRKYKKHKYYDRLNKRESTISEGEVILSEEIKKEAINKFILKIECIKWSER